MGERVKKFFYYVSKKKLTVVNAAVLLGATYLINNFLGLIREVIIANKFGAERTADIFFASFKIPDLVFQLLILGALSAAFIPVLLETKVKDGDKEAKQLANSVLNIFFLCSIAFAVILYFLIPYLVPYIFPGFFKHTQDVGYDVYQATVNSTRLMLLSPIFFSISGIFGGILNSYKRFLTYSLAPIIYNIAIIFSALFLTDNFSVPVYGLTVGVIIGAFLHMAIQVPEILKTGFKYSPRINLHAGQVKKIFKLMAPRTIAIGASQINIIVDSFVASFFIGGISILTYANDIQTVPSVVIGVAIATAIFPLLAEAYSSKDMVLFHKEFSWSFRKILFFLIPATFGIIALKAQIVRLVFGFGNFNWESTYWTILTLQFFIISLVAQGLIHLVVRAFYAIQDTKTPLYIGLVVMFINAVLALLLPFGYLGFKLGIAGVALAFTIAAFVNLALLLIFLHKKVGILDKDNKIFVSLLRLLLASGFMFLVIKGSLYFFDNFVDTERVIGLFLQTVGAIGVAAAFYFVFTYALKCEEIIYLRNKYLPKKKEEK